MSLHLSPQLPPDTERQIVEMLVKERGLNNMRFTWNLQLIARRFRIWCVVHYPHSAGWILLNTWPSRLEPQLFKSIFINDVYEMVKLYKVLLNKPPGFAQHVVKTLFFNNISSCLEVDQLVKLCSGLNKLASSDYVPTPEAIARRCLQSLASSASNAPSNLFIHPAYQSITHLEIIKSVHYCELQLDLLPCLTHLAFNTILWKDSLDWIERHLLTCLRLEVLLLLMSRSLIPISVELLLKFNFTPPLLYIWPKQTLTDDWEDHLFGENIWEKAKRHPESSIIFRKDHGLDLGV